MSRPDDPQLDDDERDAGERIIDVSSREPVIVEDDERAPFFTGGPERVRVFVAGGARTCAVPVVLVLLVICCTCAGFWVAADNFF